MKCPRHLIAYGDHFETGACPICRLEERVVALESRVADHLTNLNVGQRLMQERLDRIEEKLDMGEDQS